MNLGTPVPVNVETIEQALASLWKSAFENEGEGGVIRARSCNLVVIAQNRAEAETLPAILAQVSEWQPSRSIIAFREDHEDRSGMQAWISAQCSVPFAGGPQVCCEAIVVAATGGAGSELPYTILSLLVPDLPVFLYWRSFKESDRELVEKMTQFSNLLIVDSHASKNDVRSRDRLLELVTQAPRRIAVRDLNWSRLTAWRDLIAQFFDTPSLRHCVWEISEVNIHRTLAKAGSIPSRTLLLTGWLATRLKWERISTERAGDDWISRWKSHTGEVRVNFSGCAMDTGQTPGINFITIRTCSGATFSVVQERGSDCLTATRTMERSVLVHSVPRESLDEATLLVRELSIAGEDLGFQAALAEAVALEKSFQ